MSLNITTLVSIGQHPRSCREMRADQDARAIELGLTLSPVELTLVHAGTAQSPALRMYLGMGLQTLKVIRQTEQADIIPALVSWLQQSDSHIILTGVRAERGEASGLVPYLISEQLGWPLISHIVAIEMTSQTEARILQALPHGQRRAISVKLPFIATVDSSAPKPRQSAFGPGQRAIIDILDSKEVVDTSRLPWKQSTARKRPKRLKIVKAETAAERFRAATAKSQSNNGKTLQSESADQKAHAILRILTEEGVLK
ncbi:electron transfer flavoprotein subunit beta [Gynuella sunshinyii]|uniref:Electron transfer flavoprotein, beta subunit n=1 Tax=Gynuella sunshinyii YC6258 TaxID=1445510 RepID=A0A0C5VT43_9GAMM|nr:electron transfer flavoprotein subunit beta [Gynuella sunshinyii]AJQ93489.1 electron transfer flavoprotein, beta subunit [Gynuella sunshinyii YC6258]